jgi:hypothetical protein
MVAVAVAQAIYLGSVLSDTSLNDLGPFELLEATISGNQITRIRRQGRKCFFRRTGNLGIRQGFQNRFALPGQTQAILL